jgi:hypothetical protein
MSLTPATRVVPAVRRGTARWRAGPVAAVAAGLALLAAGCAKESSGTAVASLPSASPSASQSAGQTGDPVKYSRCIRSHGVPKFPDPSANGGLSIDASKLGVDPRGPVYKAAEEACKSLRPRGGPPPDPKAAAEAQQQVLAYSRCMRSKGIKNYPDPKFTDGGAKVELPRNLNPNSPQFKAADTACKHLMPQGGQGGTSSQSSEGPGGPGPGGPPAGGGGDS